MKKRESYLVSRISKKDFGALKRTGYTRYEQRDTRMVTEEVVLRCFLILGISIIKVKAAHLTIIVFLVN